MQTLFYNGDQNICGYGNPYLRLDGILGCAEESLDSKMLFDPFEEEFHLPSAFVKSADCQSWKRGVVGKEHQASSVGICISDTSKPLWIALLGVENQKIDQLIAHHAGAAIHRHGIDAAELEVGFGPCDKETSGLMHAVETLEVEIPTIHYIESSCFGNKQIQDVDVVHLAVADMDESWDSTTQIQKSMQFHRSLRFAELGPREHCQTEIYSSGIQSIDGFRELDGQGLLSIKPSCDADESLSEFEIDSPISDFVGVGYCTATDLASNSQVIELGRLCTQTGFDVSQTLSVCQLSKGHAQKMIQATETANVEVAAMLLHRAAESMPRCIFHHLGENEFASEHGHLPEISGKRDQNSLSYSSR